MELRALEEHLERLTNPRRPRIVLSHELLFKLTSPVLSLLLPLLCFLIVLALICTVVFLLGNIRCAISTFSHAVRSRFFPRVRSVPLHVFLAQGFDELIFVQLSKVHGPHIIQRNFLFSFLVEPAVDHQLGVFNESYRAAEAPDGFTLILERLLILILALILILLRVLGHILHHLILRIRFGLRICMFRSPSPSFHLLLLP
mmetsp:Transcript_33793/g.132809  ORF Transcript_33793/g.132809 Transcript_33793/m.132809 type:complete len:201 (-) Transcript_33793:1146-1748(-)